MAFTYSKLAETTVGVGGAATITFNNIPQNYTDLVIKASLRSTRAVGLATSVALSLNGSSTNFTYRNIEGGGTATPSSYSGSSGGLWTIDQATNTANTFASCELYIPNAFGSTNKSYSAESMSEDNTTTNNYYQMLAGLWSNVTAINSITLTPTSFNFVQHSTATLYGIRVEL
jgi:hypothetical protein